MIRFTVLIFSLLSASYAVAAASLVASPGFVTFSNTPGFEHQQFQMVSIQNMGDEPAENLLFSSSCFGTIEVANGCFGTLAPLGICTLQVSFSQNPTFPGGNSCAANVGAQNAPSAMVMIQAF